MRVIRSCHLQHPEGLGLPEVSGAGGEDSGRVCPVSSHGQWGFAPLLDHLSSALEPSLKCVSSLAWHPSHRASHQTAGAWASMEEQEHTGEAELPWAVGGSRRLQEQRSCVTRVEQARIPFRFEAGAGMV